MSKIFSLKGHKRENIGKKYTKLLKKKQKIPAIVYGKSKANIAITLSEKDIIQEYHKGSFLSQVMDLDIGSEKYRVIPKDIQLDPVSDRPVHVDFIHISDSDKIKVSVHINFLNKDKCIGVKQGGVINMIKHELDILAKPSDIPEAINLELKDLTIGANMHAKDIVLPANVELVTEPTATVVIISGRMKEEAKEQTSDESSESDTK